MAYITTNSYRPLQYQDFLEHHGIIGQKWGVRRFQNLDGSYTLAGKERYSKAGAARENKEERQKTKLNDSTKTLIAVDTALSLINPLYAVVAATEYGVGGIKAGIGAKKEKKFLAEREGEEVDKKTGHHLKGREMTIDEDLARVNPAYNEFDASLSQNCALCSVTYDLRRRGYDVMAGKENSGMTQEEFERWYPKAEHKTYKAEHDPDKLFDFQMGKKRREAVSNLKNDLIQQGDGARGSLFIWFTTGGGHAINYEIVNGKLQILDGQTNTKYLNKMDQDNLLYLCDEFNTYRLDNTEPNWETILEDEVCR